MIPIAALDRIEVLRDGASAIYGSDAIGGVINFITKKDWTGGEVAISGTRAEQSAAGEERRATLSAGFGSLERQRFNVMGVLDWQKQDVMAASDRSFANGGVFPGYGVTLGGTSSTGFPANFTQPTRTPTALGTRNPYAPGCQPDIGSIHLDSAGSLACRFDSQRYIDLVPESERKNVFGRASLALGNFAVASVEYLRTEVDSKVRVAPTPITGLSMPANNPYFPGAGSTPAVAGVDPTKPITVAWRTLQAGKRQSTDNSLGQRFVFDLEGSRAGWDWKAGAMWAKQETSTEFTNGYLQRPLIVSGLAGTTAGSTGLFLNPFGPPTAAELAFLEAAKVRGKVLDAYGEVSGVDARVSRELFNLRGGPAALALGAEWRKEKFNYDLIENNARAATSSGLELAEDITGSRKSYAAFAEMTLPLFRQLELALAVRHDHYEIIGNSTNPKLSFRYQPAKEFLVRGSAATGFRAPSVYDLYAPTSVTFTANPYNDPLLCPGGVPNAGLGGEAGRDCRLQFRTLNGGNLSLEPEKSKTNTLGFVWEPTQAFSLGVDYWRVKVRASIGTIAEQAIFATPSQYAGLFVRCGTLSAATRATIDPCGTPNSDNALAYIVTTNLNLGGIVAQGYDLSITYRRSLPVGRVVFTLDGTYTDTYDYQREKFDQFVANAGRFVDAAPIFRWQHTASAAWTTGAWGVMLTNRYKSRYTDANYEFGPTDDPAFDRTVASWSVLDLSVTFSGIKNVSLMVGAKNITDKDPPFSNQATRFQRGYDPRFADPFGRTWFARLAYTFK
jgi:iron complex outermembrane receptor protein